MKKFSRRVSFPGLRSSPSKKSLNIDDIPKNPTENIYAGITSHLRSNTSPDKKTDSFINASPDGSRPVSLFCEALDDIRFTSPLSMAEDDGISVLESSEEVLLPPPTGFGDDAASVSSGHDYEEIPHDLVLEPYLASLNRKPNDYSSRSALSVVEEFDPDLCVAPVICGDQSLLDEIEACRREAFGPGSSPMSVRNSILNEFDPLRNSGASSSGKENEDEPYYATVRAARALEKAMANPASVPPPVDFSTMPRDSVYSSYSDSSSSGFEDSIAFKEVLPKFEDSLCLGDSFPLAGFKLCSATPDGAASNSAAPVEGYLYQFNEDKKDFTRLWCTLKDGMFNPFAGPLPNKARIAKKWCLETRFITTVCSIDRASLGVTHLPDVKYRASLLSGAPRMGYSDVDSTDGSDLSFFEISSLYEASQQQKKMERRIMGALLDSDCMHWVTAVLKGVAPIKCLSLLEEMFADFSIVGSVYYKENVSGMWRTGWLLLAGSEVFLESLEEGEQKIHEFDLRKVRSVALKSVEDAGNALGVFDKGTVFVLTLPKSTLYFQSVLLKDTKNWHSRLQAAWESCGKGPELERFFLTQDDVPIIVDKCIKFVTTHGFGAEGVYRKSASNVKIFDVLEKLKRDPWGTILTNEDYTEHDVANALKRFFRTLPSPLLTEEFAHLWIAYAGVPDVERKLSGYEKLLQELPPVNRSTLKLLVWHLHSIDSQKDKNSMPATNLAPIWGPTLMTVEGTDAENHGGFAQTSEESDVLFDLITNFSRLFGVSEEELAKEAEIITALGKLREGPRAPRQSGDMRVWVYLHDAKFGSSVSITVTPTLTSGDLCAQFIREGKLKGRLSEFSVFEVLFDGSLERPLHHTEKLLPVVLQWTSWDEPYGANNFLVLKKNELYPKIAQYQALQPLSNLAELEYADRKMKSFKSYVFDFSNAILRCYKDDKDAQNQSGIPLHEWKIEDIVWYLGVESKRNPPHKWAITFVVKDTVIKKTRDLKWFGNTLAFRSEEVMLRWLSSFLYSKHRSGLIALTPPEDDLLQ